MNKISKFNLFLAFCFTLISIITSIYLKDLTFLLFILVIIIPFILKIKPVMTTIYLVFIFLAMFLGCMLHLYKITTWYDNFTHFLWGYISGYVAIYILDKFKLFNHNKLFDIFFIFILSLASSCIWEISEFIIDNLFNMDMQRKLTGVNDTMKDVIVTLLGNILFILCYKNNLLIKQFIKQLGG